MENPWTVRSRLPDTYIPPAESCTDAKYARPPTWDTQRRKPSRAGTRTIRRGSQSARSCIAHLAPCFDPHGTMRRVCPCTAGEAGSNNDRALTHRMYAKYMLQLLKEKIKYYRRNFKYPQFNSGKWTRLSAMFKESLCHRWSETLSEEPDFVECCWKLWSSTWLHIYGWNRTYRFDGVSWKVDSFVIHFEGNRTASLLLTRDHLRRVRDVMNFRRLLWVCGINFRRSSFQFMKHHSFYLFASN